MIPVRAGSGPTPHIATTLGTGTVAVNHLEHVSQRQRLLEILARRWALVHVLVAAGPSLWYGLPWLFPM